MENVLKRLSPPENLESIAKGAAPFTDASFPPSPASICPPALPAQKELLKYSSWRRAKDFFAGKPFDVFSGIEINDIDQGCLGDCYFLSSIAATAEVPERIVAAFGTKAYNQAGCYLINGYILGQKKTIVLDDQFPSHSEGPMPAFVNPNGPEIWVMLLEKAWAKVNGSFANIVLGNASEGFTFLTGAPCESFGNDDKQLPPDKIWEKIVDADRQNFIMAADCGKKEIPEKQLTTVGLVNNHTYTLIGAAEVDFGGQRARLVQIRNPWGHQEWNGMWSDAWGGWTPELKTQLQLVDKDDGTFYMPFEEYLRYYGHTTICMWKETYLHSSATVDNLDRTCHVFSICERTTGYISVLTYPDRMLRVDVPDYHSPVTYFMLGKVEGESLGYVASGKTSKEVQLTPGTYVLFSGAHYISPMAKTYAVDIYADHEVSLVGHAWDAEAFAEVCKGLARSRKSMWTREGGKDLVMYGETLFENGVGIHYIRNISKNSLFEVSYVLTLVGMKMLYPEHPAEPNTIKGKLLPNEDLIAVDQYITSDSISYSSSYSYGESSTTKRGGTRVDPAVSTFVKSVIARLNSAAANTESEPKEKSQPAPSPVPSAGKPANKVPQPKPATSPKKVPAPAEESKRSVPVSTDHCVAGHKLEFSNACSAAGDTCFVCDVCHSEGNDCSRGRWACQPCEYDVCGKCRAPPTYRQRVKERPAAAESEEDAVRCEKGHDMRVSTLRYGGGVYQCNRCHSEYACAVGRWFCETCEYDICPTCRPMPAQSSAAATGAVCGTGHPLGFSFASYPNSADYRCDLCGTTVRCSEGRWTCKACSYDVCQTCCPPPPLKCPNDHDMKYAERVEGCSKYACVFCNKVFSCRRGVVMCGYCGFFVCPDCVPALSRGKKAAAVAQKKLHEEMPNDGAMLCKQGHPLFFSYFGAPDEPYRCANCAKTRTCALGRWFCFYCRHSVCQDCKVAPRLSTGDIGAEYQCGAGHTLTFVADTRLGTDGGLCCKVCGIYKRIADMAVMAPGTAPLDPQGHPFVLTAVGNQEEMAELYRCSSCGKARSKETPYMRCAFCDYNACGDCLPVQVDTGM